MDATRKWSRQKKLILLVASVLIPWTVIYGSVKKVGSHTNSWSLAPNTKDQSKPSASDKSCRMLFDSPSQWHPKTNKPDFLFFGDQTKKPPSHGTWVNIKTQSSRSLQIQSAYFDTRRRSVVILGFTSTEENYTCQLYGSHGTLYAVPLLMFTHYIMHCELKRELLNAHGVPTHLSVCGRRSEAEEHENYASNICKSRNNAIIPVQWPQANKFAICMGTIFGEYQDWLLFIQFLEYYRMHGVSKVFITLHDSPLNSIHNILALYQSFQFVEILEWPVSRDCRTSAYYCQLTRNNFCVYQALHKYAYVGIVDMDELLYTPRHNLLEYIMTNDADHIGSFTFRPRWFPRDAPSTPWSSLFMDNSSISDIESQIPATKFTNGSVIAPPMHTTKTIVKPESVKRMWVHYVRDFISDKYQMFDVPPSEGYVRHYRNLSTWGHYFDDTLKMGDYALHAMDTGMLNALTHNIINVVRCLNSTDGNTD